MNRRSFLLAGGAALAGAFGYRGADPEWSVTVADAPVWVTWERQNLFHHRRVVRASRAPRTDAEHREFTRHLRIVPGPGMVTGDVWVRASDDYLGYEMDWTETPGPLFPRGE